LRISFFPSEDPRIISGTLPPRTLLVSDGTVPVFFVPPVVEVAVSIHWRQVAVASVLKDLRRTMVFLVSKLENYADTCLTLVV
jgi:hypothetical protein